MDLTASHALWQLARLQFIPATILTGWYVPDMSQELAAILAPLRYRVPPKLEEVTAPPPTPARGAKV